MRIEHMRSADVFTYDPNDNETVGDVAIKAARHWQYPIGDAYDLSIPSGRVLRRDGLACRLDRGAPYQLVVTGGAV